MDNNISRNREHTKIQRIFLSIVQGLIIVSSTGIIILIIYLLFVSYRSYSLSIFQQIFGLKDPSTINFDQATTFFKFANNWVTLVIIICQITFQSAGFLYLNIRRRGVIDGLRKTGLILSIRKEFRKVKNISKKMGKDRRVIEAYKKILEKLKNEDKMIELLEAEHIFTMAQIKYIYSLKNDKDVFFCCMESIKESAKKSKYLFISGIAQYVFIGKYASIITCKTVFKSFLDNKITDKKDQESISQSPFFQLLLSKRKLDLVVILLDPDSPNSTDIIRVRMAQLKLHNYRSIRHYKSEIRSTIKFLKNLKSYFDEFGNEYNKEINIKLFVYDDEPIFRYYLTGNRLFLAQYLEKHHGHEAMVYEIQKTKKSLHYSFDRLIKKRLKKLTRIL